MYDYTVLVNWDESDPLFGSEYVIAGFSDVVDANTFAEVKAAALVSDDHALRVRVKARYPVAANITLVDVNLAARRAARADLAAFIAEGVEGAADVTAPAGWTEVEGGVEG